MDKPRRTLVLVADASRARLYERDAAPNKLLVVQEFEHPEGRAKASDLMADKAGRTLSSGPTSTARSVMQYRTDPKDVEAEKFARELVQHLVASFDAHELDDLVIAAPPKFLGLLRSTLATHHDHISDRVIAWHEKDYTNITHVRELSELLFPGE